MKRDFFLFVLLSFVLVACAGGTPPTQPTAEIAASVTAEIQPTETSIPAATPIPTLTLAPTATSAPTPGMIPTLSLDLGLLPWEEIGGVEPKSNPLTEWCGIPIMNTALAGDIMDQTYYVYKTSSLPMDIYNFYLVEMPKLGWELYLVGTDAVNATPVEAANLEEFHPSLFYQKDSFNQSSNITMMGDFQNNLIYVMIVCGS